MMLAGELQNWSEGEVAMSVRVRWPSVFCGKNALDEGHWLGGKSVSIMGNDNHYGRGCGKATEALVHMPCHIANVAANYFFFERGYI